MLTPNTNAYYDGGAVVRDVDEREADEIARENAVFEMREQLEGDLQFCKDEIETLYRIMRGQSLKELERCHLYGVVAALMRVQSAAQGVLDGLR